MAPAKTNFMLQYPANRSRKERKDRMEKTDSDSKYRDYGANFWFIGSELHGDCALILTTYEIITKPRNMEGIA